MQVYAGLQPETGKSLDERLPREMNGSNISAYHTVQTGKEKNANHLRCVAEVSGPASTAAE